MCNSHNSMKLVHASCNALALGSIAVGLYVTFATHSPPHVSVPSAQTEWTSCVPPECSELALILLLLCFCERSVTLHSWLALVSCALLLVQAGGGALFFAAPAFAFRVRALMLPQHGQYSSWGSDCS